MALESQIRLGHVVDVKALQHLGNDILGRIALLYHMGYGIDLLQIGFEFGDTFLCSIRQRLDKETAGADTLEVRIYENPQTDAGRRLFRYIEILGQVVSDFPVRDLAAARDGISKPRKAGDGYSAATNTDNPIKQKQMVSRLLWSFNRMNEVMVPAIAAAHIKTKSAHPHAPS